MRDPIRRGLVAGVWGLAAIGAMPVPCGAQAPSVSQIWEVRFVTDCRDAPAIGITLQARVAIIPNAAGVANFGVLRCGGAEGSVMISITDPNGDGAHGTIVPGATGELGAGGALRLDTSGQSLRGTFFPFRGVFAPAGTGGANGDPFNGLARVGDDGRPTLTALVNSRIGLWDGVPRGAAVPGPTGALVGSFADVYRCVYVPAARTGRDYEPTVTLTAQNLSARYVYAMNGTTPLGAPVYPIPEQTVAFDTVIGPVVWREPVGGEVCEGGRVTLSPRIVGLRPMTFQWFRNGEPVAGATGEALTLENVDAAKVGAYYLTATSACGSAATEPVEVRLSAVAPPVFHAQPAGVAACLERPVVLSAGVTPGSGPVTYQWLRGATGAVGVAVGSMTPVAAREGVTGTQGPVLSLSSVAAEDAAEYRLRVTWSCGERVSEAARVTVEPRRPVVTRQPVGASVAAGLTARFVSEVVERDAPAGSPSGVTLRWHKDMVPLYDSSRVSGAATAVLEVRGATAGDAGRYQLLAINTCRSVVSDYATLEVVTPAYVATPPTGRGVLSGEGEPARDDGDGRQCVADFDGNGAVDADDLADVVACYGAAVRCPGLDFDRDGDVDADDLADFIAAFFSGCG